MKLFHISDLHIGKQLNGYSLRESQEELFRQIIDFAREEQPDAVLLCGDIYDKSIPSAEAFTVFDRFLTGLSEAAEQAEILVISGNHDSPERLDFGGRLLEESGVWISGAFHTPLTRVTLSDDFGPVRFTLLPYLKPEVAAASVLYSILSVVPVILPLPPLAVGAFTPRPVGAF